MISLNEFGSRRSNHTNEPMLSLMYINREYVPKTTPTSSRP